MLHLSRQHLLPIISRPYLVALHWHARLPWTEPRIDCSSATCLARTDCTQVSRGCAFAAAPCTISSSLAQLCRKRGAAAVCYSRTFGLHACGKAGVDSSASRRLCMRSLTSVSTCEIHSRSSTFLASTPA